MSFSISKAVVCDIGPAEIFLGSGVFPPPVSHFSVSSTIPNTAGSCRTIYLGGTGIAGASTTIDSSPANCDSYLGYRIGNFLPSRTIGIASVGKEFIPGRQVDFEIVSPSVGIGDYVTFISKSVNNGVYKYGIWNFDYSGELIGVLEFRRDPTNTYLQWRAWPGIELYNDGTSLWIRGVQARVQGGYIQIAMQDQVTNRYTDAGPGNNSKTYTVLFRDADGNKREKTVRVRGYTMYFDADPLAGALPLKVSFVPRWVIRS